MKARLSILAAASAILVTSAQAIQIPNVGSNVYLQTNGVDNPIGTGDWYSAATSQGGGGGSNYFEIYVPLGWPSSGMNSTRRIFFDLLSPDLNSNATDFPRDEQEGASYNGNAVYQLYGPFAMDAVVVDPTQPANVALLGTAIQSATYAPNTIPHTQWARAFNIIPTVNRKYILRVTQAGDDQNSWVLRVGRDNDGNAQTLPPADFDNPDGLAGTGDELAIAVLAGTFQHDVGGGTFLDGYEFIPPGLASVNFHNFDIDSAVNTIVYRRPDGTTINGTTSGNAAWNNGTTNNGAILRGTGDVIANPQAGWWRTRTTIAAGNQWITEGRAPTAMFLDNQPRYPNMTVTVTSSPNLQVALNDVFPVSVSYVNTGAPTGAEGAATTVSINVSVPARAAYDGNFSFPNMVLNTDYTINTSNAPPGGGGFITITLLRPVPHSPVTGNTRSFSYNLRVISVPPPDVPQNMTSTATLSYRDVFANPYPNSVASDATPLFVDLESFSAHSPGPGFPIVISWVTATEVDNAGFNVYRGQLVEGVYTKGEKLNTILVPAAGGTGVYTPYSLEDPVVPGPGAPNRVYFLEDIDLNGTVTLHGPIVSSMGANSAPTEVRDWMNY